MLSTQVANVEQEVLSVLGSVKGRGSSGLEPEQLQQLNAAIEALEKDGGVAGDIRRQQLRLLTQHVVWQQTSFHAFSLRHGDSAIATHAALPGLPPLHWGLLCCSVVCPSSCWPGEGTPVPGLLA